MRISRKIDWDELSKILSPVDQTLKCDLEELRRKDERERTSSY